MGVGPFIAKVKGVILRHFLGGLAPKPPSSSPIHLLTANYDCYVDLISKRSVYKSIQFYLSSHATILVGEKVSLTAPRKLLGTGLHAKNNAVGCHRFGVQCKIEE